jgi:hypothetical protein
LKNENSKKSKISIVLTTINIPFLLKKYLENFNKFQYENVSIIIIGDKKSPKKTINFLNKIKTQYEINYLDFDSQNQYIKKNCPSLRNVMYENSIQRRNLGYLIAVKNGAEKIVSIDDDNFILNENEDYLKFHNEIGSEIILNTYKSSTEWFNICQFAKTENSIKFYHRGYPLSKRSFDEKFEVKKKKINVSVNVGMWTEDPDVDTFVRIQSILKVKKYTFPKNGFCLHKSTYSPFNSQNTSFKAELLPCFFLIPIGKVNNYFHDYNFRYDDIWQSYIAQKIMKRCNFYVRYGHPIVKQNRNNHNYAIDFNREALPLFLTEIFINILNEIQLSSNNILDCYDEFLEKFYASIIKQNFSNIFYKHYFLKVYKNLKIWQKTIKFNL